MIGPVIGDKSWTQTTPADFGVEACDPTVRPGAACHGLLDGREAEYLAVLEADDLVGELVRARVHAIYVALAPDTAGADQLGDAELEDEIRRTGDRLAALQVEKSRRGAAA